MNDFLEKLMAMAPELSSPSLRRYIGNGLAGNYSKGLNGPYAVRLREGIRAATTSTADQLINIVQSLLNERRENNCPDKVDIPSDEDSLRILILALWTNRSVSLGRDGVWQASGKPCYGKQDDLDFGHFSLD